VRAKKSVVKSRPDWEQERRRLGEEEREEEAEWPKNEKKE